MIDRRDLLIALAAAGAVGASEWLRPRREVRLLAAGQTLSKVVPTRIPGWGEAAGGDVVIPRTAGSLASRLYSDELARSYRAGDDSSAPPIMLLIAYGSSQSDSLQLHRPEACYPASGFSVTAPLPFDVRLENGRSIPAVAMTATLADRVEDIIYWTRLGDAMPRSEEQQRRRRLDAAMSGRVDDGLLLRASAIRDDSGSSQFTRVNDFLRSLVGALSPTSRKVLLGSQLSALS